MKKIRFIFVIIVGFYISSIIVSCEGFRCANGQILDGENLLPLDSVKCVVLDKNDTIYSDYNGRFYACTRMRGCVFGCGDIEIEFSKDNYKTLYVKNPKTEEFHLERIE